MDERTEPHKPVLVKPVTAARMLDCGLTKIYELMKTGALEVRPLGADRRITVSSIERMAK